MADTRLLRDRREETAAQLDRARLHQPDRPPALAGTIANAGSMPTHVPAFFAVRPSAISSVEGEALPGSVRDSVTALELVLVLGPQVPQAGDRLVAFEVGDRWVAQFDGPASRDTIALPGCFCTQTPRTLALVSNNHEFGGGMFQDATLAYTTTPAWAVPLGLGDSCFLSTASFVDQDTGDSFYYYFACGGAVYTLSRAYPTSSFGSPYLDSARYLWLVGSPGNSCIPFRLLYGQIYSGGDPSVVVTVTG